MGRKAPEIGTYFSSAKQSQQLSEAEAEIQRLKKEIEQLRQDGSIETEAQLQILRSKLGEHTGMASIDIERIFPNPDQPRQTFLAQSIDAIAQSLDKDGQLEPIILIKRGDDYLIFDGERRWRGARKINWTQLKAVIISEPQDLHRKAFLTSQHREDPNTLDKAEAIVREVSSNTNLAPQDIPRILSTVIRRLNKQKKIEQVLTLITASRVEQQQGVENLAELGLEEKEQKILLSLLDLQLNPASVDANIFPMLSLADDLKVAIREKGLKGVCAMSLQTLNAKNLETTDKKARTVRVKATEEAIAEKLSASQTRKLVAAIRAEYVRPDGDDREKNLLVQPISQITDSLQKLQSDTLEKVEISQLKTVQSLLNQKLQEIEMVIQKREKAGERREEYA
jgi:ParB family transcriptional regulator, chromosome partitioning protein